MVFANKHFLYSRINSHLMWWCTNGSFGVLWNSSVLFLGFRGSVFDRYCQLYHILSGKSFLKCHILFTLQHFSNLTIMVGSPQKVDGKTLSTLQHFQHTRCYLLQSRGVLRNIPKLLFGGEKIFDESLWRIGKGFIENVSK